MEGGLPGSHDGLASLADSRAAEQAASSGAIATSPSTSGLRGNAGSVPRSAIASIYRPVTPPPLKHNYGWSKFEPVRLKLIKRSEARYFLNFFIRQMHSFAPHCSPHLLDKSPEALSELVCREPILLGAMLSVASRYDVANHNAHVTAVDTFHRKISKWTQEKISRSFFLPASHTIGTIEALLILSEWATLDLHDRRTSPDASSDSEDSEEDIDDGDGRDSEADEEADGASTTIPAIARARGADSRLDHEGLLPQRGRSKRSGAKPSQKPRQADMRESEKFDDTAWMLTGTALRLAERLDLHNDATYSGISSRNVASRRNAERRMRVWMSSVHADCHLSVRLGRRISSPGLAAPFMNLVRDRTHPFLLNADISNSSEVGFPSGSNRAWIAFRAHAELLQIVFRTCENLYRSKAVTERLLEDEDFVPALKSIRDDLDNWANWTQPRIEPTRDMTSLRVRVEYHYARLYANGIALDSVKRSLRTLRNHRQYRASEAAEIGSKGRLGRAGANATASASASYTVSFSTHPAYPFVREALAAAQSLIRILTVELESMMCAPARWFLLLVMATVFCVKATAVSDVILPLKRCAQSLQQVITALERAAPDGVHLANRYSMYLRQLAKQLVRYASH
uniref:C6 transcription factor n=1 Tax=Kalmanozyma brasiliensis (strain GHG001) TaxID=1365824 RepID=V5GUT2_KALBG